MFSTAKMIAAGVAALLAAVAVLYPEHQALAATLAGVLLGKEYLPQAPQKPKALK